MVDFVSIHPGATTDTAVTNATSLLPPAVGQTLIHTGNNGVVLYNASPVSGVRSNIIGRAAGSVQIVSVATTGSEDAEAFNNPNGQVGSISLTANATAYNVSSDPELKHFKQAPTDEMINSKFNDLFDSFRVFNWKTDPDGDLVWGFDAWVAVDNKCGIGTDRRGPRESAIGEVYNVVPAVIEQQEVQVVYKSGDKEGELRFNADNSPMMETADVVVEEEIEEKVTPAGVDQAKAVPILLAKIEQLERRLKTLEGGS